MGRIEMNVAGVNLPRYPTGVLRSAPRMKQISRSLAGGFIIYLLLIGAARCGATPESLQSRSFNGVVASFRIKNPIISVGEDLKIIVVYRNTGTRAVKFRFYQVDEWVELFRKGENESIAGGFVGEPQFEEVTIKPGKSVRVEQTFNMKGWPYLAAGKYEIRFFYHLGLLFDESLIKQYQAKYPHPGYVVAWSNRRYPFRLSR